MYLNGRDIEQISGVYDMNQNTDRNSRYVPTKEARRQGTSKSAHRSREYERKPGGRSNYANGNAVRKVQAAPERKRREQQRPVTRTPEQEQRYRQSVHTARRNRQRSQVMNRKYVIFLSVATLICAVACGMYIYTQASMAMNLKQITALESQLAELKADNDIEQTRIDMAVDLSTVRQEAEQKLGMKYPGKDQVRYYSVENSDYMNQYGSVD